MQRHVLRTISGVGWIPCGQEPPLSSGSVFLTFAPVVTDYRAPSGATFLDSSDSCRVRNRPRCELSRARAGPQPSAELSGRGQSSGSPAVSRSWTMQGWGGEAVPALPARTECGASRAGPQLTAAARGLTHGTHQAIQFPEKPARILSEAPAKFIPKPP
ncbi:hypothetical protein P7K49_033906 [Saguinus oedipus]|uniref:Uncharacterized protein n=1 Tax=Saguinus oedipus TaxID=9490 RepID=A0ABQ9TTP8_SAGOE|nr:hypothetical protein P7K49_033906 [Saguinus oedipus]